MRVAIALLAALSANEAWACDDYSDRKVVGFSADGAVVVSRVSGSRPGPGEWIRIETHELPSLKLQQKWDIVTKVELEKRLAQLKGEEWVPENDGVIAKVRAKRWKAVETELTGKGFVIDPHAGLPVLYEGTQRGFRLEALGAELWQVKSANYDDECPNDLVLRGGKKDRIILPRAVTGCAATGIPWFVGAYVARGGKYLILVRAGACAEPTMTLIPYEKLSNP